MSQNEETLKLRIRICELDVSLAEERQTHRRKSEVEKLMDKNIAYKI